MPNPDPLPVQDEIAQRPKLSNGDPNPNAYHVGDTWLQFFAQTAENVQETARRINLVTITNQNTSIGATDITADVLPEGLYRVTVYEEITTAAVTSSSLTTTIGFTHNSGAKTFVGTALTGNTTATVGTATYSFLIDGGSPITYSTAYASNGAGQMRYTLSIWLEQAGQQ